METKEESPKYGEQLWPESHGSPTPYQRGLVTGSWNQVIGSAVAVLLLASVAVFALAHTAKTPTALLLASASPASHPGRTATPTTAPSRAAPAAGVYAALVGHIYEGHWQLAYVSPKICTQSLNGKQGRCFGSMSNNERFALTTRLHGRDVRVEAAPGNMLMDPRYAYTNKVGLITLGPIVEVPGGVQVEAGYACGETCGLGTTYILHKGSNGWKVTGTTGDYWIS